MAQHPSTQGSARAEGLTRGEWIAFWLCAGWLVAAGLFFWALPSAEVVAGQPDVLRWVLVLIAVFMPVGLVWVAAAATRQARIMRAEAFRLQTALDDLRQMHLAQAATQRRAEPAEATFKTSAKPPEVEGTGFTSRREVSRLITPRAAPQVPSDQPTLAFDPSPEEEAPPLARPDLIKALNFPDDEHDKAGFAALRRALRDRTARRLVQASQDLLTLMSQDGIYTDDLRPDPVPADLWRRFAKGERGKEMDRLGAIRDRDALAVTAARMREDTIFRDTVHHFLRRFDEMLVTFEDQATDTDLLALSETRTARAFMLLARTSGTFD